MNSGATPMTTTAAAKHFGVKPWQVRRVYESGLVPPPARAGTYRLIGRADLPRVEEALRLAGYLPAAEVNCA
jgi:DNA-binding transcriptional MerR regulator